MNESHIQIRSLGEAHCYVAIVKSDGTVTTHEKARAPFHAARAQRSYNVMRSNERLAEIIADDVRAILADTAYRSWNAEQHLEEAVRLLKQAHEEGAQGVDITASKIEHDIRELAYIDGYDLKESRFVERLLERVRQSANLDP